MCDLFVYCMGRTDQLPFTCGSRVLPIAQHTELDETPLLLHKKLFFPCHLSLL